MLTTPCSHPPASPMAESALQGTPSPLAGEPEQAFLCPQHSGEHRASPGKLRGRKGGEHNRDHWPSSGQRVQPPLAWCSMFYPGQERHGGSPPFLSEEVEPWGLKLAQDHSAYKGQWQRENPGSDSNGPWPYLLHNGASPRSLCISRMLCRGWWGVPGVLGWMCGGKLCVCAGGSGCLFSFASEMETQPGLCWERVWRAVIHAPFLKI